MSKKIFLDAFFNQFTDFLDQLVRVFPEDSDFLTFKTGLSLLRRTNPMLVVEQVYKHVLPYEEILRAKNEDFFLKRGFQDHIDGDDTLDQLIEKLKGLWGSLTDHNKNIVWSYTTLLLDLAKRCVALSTA
jgi:hypothetical protein